MSRNINQIYMDNPSTTSGDDDLFYKGNDPYSPADDSAIKWSDMVADIGSLNLNFLSNNQTSFSNLGLGSGDDLIIDESDFVAGLYTLTNPCPNLIFVNAETAGNAVRLPPVNEAESFIPSQGPVFFIQSGFEGIDVQDSSGAVISPLVAPGCEQFVLTSNAFPAGVWFVRSFVSTVNGMSGDVLINGSSQSLDETYNSGDNAEVNLVSSRPVIFNGVSNGISTNSVSTPSTGNNTVANNRVLGWTFTSATNITITALQYDNALFSGTGTRETGIFVKSTGELLGSVFIAKTDPLISGFRTTTLDNPIQIQAGIEYVYATVMAAGETNRLNSDAVPAAGISIIETAILPSSGFPLPLSFPQSFNVVSNEVFVGSFVFSTFVIDESVNINDIVTNPASIIEVNSTTRGTIAEPLMTTAQFAAIASKPEGLRAWDTDKGRPTSYDGSVVQDLAFLEEVLLKANNLSDVADAYTSGNNLQLLRGPAVTLTNSIGFPNFGLSAPLAYFYTINSSANAIITLCTANIATSPRLGQSFYFLNLNNGFTAQINDSSNNPLVTIPSGSLYMFQLDTNVTSNGTWHFTSLIYSGNPAAGDLSGTYPNPNVSSIGGKAISLANSFTTSGNFPVVQTYTGSTNVTFPTSGTLSTTSGSIPSIQGTANEVLVNGTSGSPVSGTDIILTTPQDIGTASSPTFSGLTANTLVSAQTHPLALSTPSPAAGVNATDITLTGANGTVGGSNTSDGGGIVLTGGNGAGSSGAAGGEVTLTGGNSASIAGDGGPVTITGGKGRLLGADVTISGGQPQITNSDAGNLNLNGGLGLGLGLGGNVNIFAGNSGTGGTGGNVVISAGIATGGIPGIIEFGNGKVQFDGLTASTLVATDSSKQLSSAIVSSLSPTFTGLNLSGLTASTLIATDGSKNLTSSVTGLSPTFTGLNLSGLTASSLVATDSSKNLTSSTTGLAVQFSTLAVGAALNAGEPFTVTGSGSSSVGYALGTFTSPSSTTAGNFFGININKNGAESLLLGINKNSTTGSVPSNGIYISTYTSAGVISIGRGNGTGVPNTQDIGIDGSGNIGLTNTAISAGSGTAVIFIGNRSAAPSTNPTGGGILYAESGALKYRGSSGTVTTIAPA